MSAAQDIKPGQFLQKLALVTALISIAACSSGGGGSSSDSEPESNDRGFSSLNTSNRLNIDETHFITSTPDGTRKLNAHELLAGINGNRTFYNNRPVQDIEVSDFSRCYYQEIVPRKFSLLKDDMYEWHYKDVNILHCEEQVDYTEGYIESMKVSEYLLTALNDFSGNTMHIEGEDITVLDPAYFDQKYFSQYEYTVVFRYSDGAIGEHIMKELQSDATEPDNPCITNAETLVLDNCVHRSLDNFVVWVDNEVVQADPFISILKMNNLQLSQSGTYYTQGTIEFSINNWQGTMTYSASNTEKAPSFTASNGIDTISGTFGSSSLNTDAKGI